MLDGPSKKIWVFNQETYLFSIGQGGEGPGEFRSPASMAHADGKLYTIDQTKVDVFDLEGKVLDSWRLKKTGHLTPFIGDLYVHNDRLIVSFDKGTSFLRA